ncbi:MAG: hypothetical protein N2512_03600 [Armatimonadetes bacterium]|nr:hypothetical protein [Armatimonadota bacterium]
MHKYGRPFWGMEWVPVIFLLISAHSFSAAEEASLTAVAAVSLPTTTTTSYPGHEGHRYTEQNATLDLGKVTYGIKYCACIDDAHAPGVGHLEGYIGMPLPHVCNWYHSGFMRIVINGQDIGTTRLSSMAAVESGERAIVDLVWHHQVADVRARFVGLPGEDHIYCELAVEPKEEVRSIEAHLTCYPSFFTSFHGRNGARRVKTPAALVVQDEQQVLPVAENWWAVYYDEVFDVAKHEGEGPCAMMVLPTDAQEIHFHPQAYPCFTRVVFNPSARRLRMAFWDFVDCTNADVLAAMPEEAEKARRFLETADLTPAGFKLVGAAETLAEVEEALQRPKVREQLGARAGEIEKWLADTRPLLTDPALQGTIAGQERLAVAVQRFNEFVWELKIAELLDF